MGNAEQKCKSDSQAKIEPSLKGSTKGVHSVERTNLKVPLDISGKAKDAGKSKPPVPERTSSLKPEERLRKEIDITLPQSKVAKSSRAADQNLDEEYSTRTDELEIKPERKLMVAAVDFGTTYSGYAFSFTHDLIGMDGNPDKIFASNWEKEGGSRFYHKTPTCLLLDPYGNLDSFGIAAMVKYSSLTDDNKHHDWYFFWQFKMVLHQEEEIRADTIVTEENGKTLEAIKVFQYSILYLKDRLMKDVNRGFGDRIEETDIRWVFTVPAIWNDSAKKFMRQAAEQAGIKKDLIEIALEPESASMYCSTVNFCRTEHGGSSIRKFPIGTRYMVLDCGGGTVDVTVHEVLQENRLRELQAATGGNWGGIEVNKAFSNFVSQLIGPENFQTFSTENKEEYLELLENFETKKYSANPQTTRSVKIRIPATLSDIIKANQSNFEKVKGIRIMRDKLIIEADHFTSFFEKPVKDILNHVEEQVKIAPGKLDTILLVGGFAESPILQKAVEDRFNDRFNIITPLNASICVLKGAVLYGLNPVSVAYRVSRYTYGVSTSMRYQEGVHPQKRKAAGAKEAFCDDIFDVHVKINQEVPTNKAVTERTYYPITNDDKLLHITLYRSSKEDPKFVDEEDCQPVGTMEIKVDTSVGKTSRDRPVKVKMIFGGSDIKVLAQQNDRKPPQEADFKLNGMF